MSHRHFRAEVSVEIARPVGEVFTALCDARSWPTWARWASQVSVEPAGPIRGGSVVRITRKGVGVGRATDWLVTDLRPDRLVALEHEAGHRRIWFHLDPAAGSTTVTGRVERRSGGWLPFLKRRAEQSVMRADLRRLKSVLGSAGGATSLVGQPGPSRDGGSAPVTSTEAARRGR
jgi:hypothetical protein